MFIKDLEKYKLDTVSIFFINNKISKNIARVNDSNNVWKHNYIIHSCILFKK